MDNPARPSDLASLGYDGAASEAVQKSWLDVAWRALCRESSLRSPSVESRLALPETDPNHLDVRDVVDVVASAALRVLRNPEGTESESGAIDDYTEAWKRADATQDVYFTAAELRRLAPAAASGAFTVRPATTSRL